MKDDGKKTWEMYCEKELARVEPILHGLGFKLDSEQPHISGERYLMQAITTTSGRKLILLGTHMHDKKRVVIKASSDKDGVRELEHDRNARKTLEHIGFAYQTFFSPQEILFTKQGEFTISVQEFIDQQPFLERSDKEQFHLALKAFKAQESAHATTYKHRRFIQKTLGEKRAKDYFESFDFFKKGVLKEFPDKKSILNDTDKFLKDQEEIIEQYCGFMTHTDFVPHNFRILEDTIHLLDHSSIRFGNKYEGWARFINFMALYNPQLASWLVQYVKDNRTPEESFSLKAMRVYRLAEIMYYYTTTLPKTSGNLHELNMDRIELWSQVLAAVLADRAIPETTLETYKTKRDALRSKDEKKRQQGLH